MRINTCGSKEKPCILLLHTMFTTGRLFEALIPALAQDYFLVIPTLDGYDPDEKTEYPGTGEELERVEACLKEKQVRELAAAAGSSLGAMPGLGAVAAPPAPDSPSGTGQSAFWLECCAGSGKYEELLAAGSGGAGRSGGPQCV